MQKHISLTLLLGTAALVQAAGPSAVAQATSHPLLGNWSWTLSKNSCAETLQYGADEIRKSTSGEEVTQSRYSVSPKPSLLGFYRVTETVIQANAKKDCSGDLHEVSGEPVTRFIQFSPDLKKMLVCREASLKACFGPLQRQTDQG